MESKAVNVLPEYSSLFTANQRFTSLTQGTAAEILNCIDTLYMILLTAGIPTRPYTMNSAEVLLSLDPEKAKRILESLKFSLEIFKMSEGAPALDFRQEAKMVEKVLEHFNFNLKRHKWDNTDEDQILEVYNMNGVQIYRSMGFFKTCGYSLLDLCLNEWFILWDRPQKILQEMNVIVSQVLSGQKKDTNVELPAHLVLESYDDGCTQPFLPRAIFVNFKNIYPLYSTDDRICGFVVSSTAKVISEGNESKKFDFI